MAVPPREMMSGCSSDDALELSKTAVSVITLLIISASSFWRDLSEHFGILRGLRVFAVDLETANPQRLKRPGAFVSNHLYPFYYYGIQKACFGLHSHRSVRQNRLWTAAAVIFRFGCAVNGSGLLEGNGISWHPPRRPR